uniref:Uncharacterized protein n=1 Tax=Steinernema glaseri TaxID=37863 RepID=A0A1I7ZSR8_9BILA
MMAPSIRPSYAPSAIHSVAGHSTSASIQERTRQLLGWTENVLVDTVSHVIDLEQQLEELNEHAEMLRQQQHVPLQNECFPDDLETVDVSAFKHLICSDASAGFFPFDACLPA